MKMQGQSPEPHCDILCPSVASQLVSKMPQFSIFSKDTNQKGEISFEQWAFQVKSVMQSQMEVTLRGE